MSELLYKGDKNLTSIIVRKTTREHLRNIAHKAQTYDSIINELILLKEWSSGPPQTTSTGTYATNNRSDVND